MNLVPELRRPISLLLGIFALLVCDIRVSAQQVKERRWPRTPPIVVSAADRLKIEAALPAKAAVSPARPRKLLIFDRNVGYPGHPAIAYANLAFSEMGKKTGAFEAVVSHDPAVFAPDNLKQYDAVFLNSTVGNIFEDPAWRQSLDEFVYSGGGLLGVHGTTFAFTRWPGAHEDWPEFGFMLGGRGGNHRAQDEHAFLKMDSPDHPLNRPFGGKGFDYRDEFYRVRGPYSRDRLRVLFSIDTDKTDLSGKEPERADNDYAQAWVRNYGRGRVFYCSIGHNPYVFYDSRMLQFYLGAIQFALGDLPAPTTPSSRLTPATLAQEKVGWRLGMTAYSLHKFTLFETIEKSAQLGLSYLGGLSFQKVSKEIPKNFDAALTDDELRQVRSKLDSAGIRMLTHFMARIPGDEAGCRRVFEFGRKMGVETFISEPPLEALDMIEKFCDEYNINLAIHNHDEKASPHYWHPEKLLKVCQGRSKRIGTCPDIGYWIRSGIDPIEGIRTLKDRVMVVQLHDLHELGSQGHDVPWGTGVGQAEKFLKEIHRLGIQPTMFGLEYSYDWFDSMPEMAQSIEFFNKTSLKVAR